jgi:hypothetical protein
MEKFEPMETWQKDAINPPFHPSPVSKRAKTVNPWPTVTGKFKSKPLFLENRHFC